VKSQVIAKGAAGFGGLSMFKAPQFILYGNLICPFAQRATIAALEKSVPFTFFKVPLSGEIKKNPALFKPPHFLTHVNPEGTVPAIEFGNMGGVPINESDVCCFFLEDAFPGEGTQLKPRNAGPCEVRSLSVHI
jgi:glutathione S-transferase